MRSLLKKSNHKQGMQKQQSWANPIDRFFGNDFLSPWDEDLLETIPSINIKEEKDEYKIELAAPGLKKEDFDVDIDGNILTISAEKESESSGDGKKDNYSRREYNYSSFSRSLTLPENVDSTKIDAQYADGVLNLVVPKKPGVPEKTSKKVEVR